MQLVLAKSIAKREFPKGLSRSELALIRKSILKHLATFIKGDALPPFTRLAKYYITSPNGAQRMVCLVHMQKNDYFLLFYRDKKDKLGTNISFQNLEFRVSLKKYFVLLQEDLIRMNFQTYEL